MNQEQIEDVCKKIGVPLVAIQIAEPTSQVAGHFTGKYCMVRTYSAGVFAGWLQRRDRDEVLLTDARRIHMWEGAASLSQLATSGTSAPDQCRFPEPVAEVLLLGTIEIIPITEKAAASIASVPVWKA